MIVRNHVVWIPKGGEEFFRMAPKNVKKRLDGKNITVLEIFCRSQPGNFFIERKKPILVAWHLKKNRSRFRTEELG